MKDEFPQIIMVDKTELVLMTDGQHNDYAFVYSVTIRDGGTDRVQPGE